MTNELKAVDKAADMVANAITRGFLITETHTHTPARSAWMRYCYIHQQPCAILKQTPVYSHIYIGFMDWPVEATMWHHQ
jgi:hypothetical protein